MDDEDHERLTRVLTALEKKDEMQQRMEAITKSVPFLKPTDKHLQFRCQLFLGLLHAARKRTVMICGMEHLLGAALVTATGFVYPSFGSMAWHCIVWHVHLEPIRRSSSLCLPAPRLSITASHTLPFLLSASSFLTFRHTKHSCNLSFLRWLAASIRVRCRCTSWLHHKTYLLCV